MKYTHIPVLFDEVMEGLAVRPKGTYVDGTLGGGGHALGVCERLSWDGHFIGIDRDPQAVEAATATLAHATCRKSFVCGNYADLLIILESLQVGQVDGILLDLGVSSFQLDTPERGFSYMRRAPLDMRMNPDDGLTAEQVVNEYSRERLARILSEYGEERYAASIARRIVQEREKQRIETTDVLSDIIASAIPAKSRREGPHPAKRSFQAIRIEVNDELEHLKQAVSDAVDALASGGRLAIISFHSLEDRIVKRHFKQRLSPCTCPPDLPVCACGRESDIKQITGKPIEAGVEETTENPRARSAKLRIIEKL